MSNYNFVESTFMVPYTKDVADYRAPLSCGDDDLDEFFSHDVFLYEEELLGKTYCWINRSNQKEIVAIATLSYDGIKTNNLDNPSRNVFQRKIPQQKRHRSYPAVLIGRLGVNRFFRGHGLNVGTQLMSASNIGLSMKIIRQHAVICSLMPTIQSPRFITISKTGSDHYISLNKVRKQLLEYRIAKC